MFKVAFGKDLPEENIIKEFNNELPRNYFEMQVCFSSVKRYMFEGFATLYLGMTLLDGVEEFINKLHKEYNNINIDVLEKSNNNYLIKVDVSEDYPEKTRGLVIYVICCIIRLFYEDNFGILGWKYPDVPNYLEEDIFKFILKRNIEASKRDSLHCLYDHDIQSFTKEAILAFDNIEIMSAVAKRIDSGESNVDSTYAQNNIIYNTIQCLQLEKEI